jgi:hypothetical protein
MIKDTTALLRLLTLLFLVALAMACQQQPKVNTPKLADNLNLTGDHLSTLQQAIQGGYVDNQRTNVVGLVIQQGRYSGACTGSLIAPNLVLTAQHCIAPTPANGILCGSSRFGDTYNPSDVYVTTQTELPNFGYYGVREVWVPEENADVCGNDVALLILAQNIPAREASILTPRLDEPVEVGELFTAAGYGHTGNGNGAGVRRSIQDRYVICSGYRNGCQDGNQSIYENEWLGNNGTCQGDSGGPALDDLEQVFGVLSRGAEGCEYPVYTGVTDFEEWIRQIATRASMLGSYTSPGWVTGVAGQPLPDTDNDGILDRYDNCDEIANETQQDIDNDTIGDMCDDVVSNDRGGRCIVCNQCNRDSDCGSNGGVCLTLQSGNICTYPCVGSFDCPDTTTCVSVDARNKYCINDDFQSNNVCPSGYQCGGERNSATLPDDDGSCEVCKSCRESWDCISGVCADIGENISNFVCTRTCEINDDCRDGSVCVEQQGRKLCVNANHDSVGICPDNLVCGDMSTPNQPDTQSGTEAGAEAGSQAGTEINPNINNGGTDVAEEGGVVTNGGNTGNTMNEVILVVGEDDETDKATNSCEQSGSQSPYLLLLLGMLFMRIRRSYSL